MTKNYEGIDPPAVFFREAREFETWLAENVNLQEGVWLKIAKKTSGIQSLTADEAVDIGLCYGWISGKRKRGDDTYYLQKYVPRRRRSRWSKVNVDKVHNLIGKGRMQLAGFAEMESAVNDGRWAEAYEPQRTATIPTDLAASLKSHSRADKAFSELNKSQQYLVVLKLTAVRSAIARAALLQKIIKTLEEANAATTEGRRSRKP